jgi:pyruvate,orthophosphate dikinase
VQLACERGRATNPDLHLGICGEHGGDPQSIDFFDRAGLEYVSCSPYRVPIARLAAARATLQRAAEKPQVRPDMVAEAVARPVQPAASAGQGMADAPLLKATVLATSVQS